MKKIENNDNQLFVVSLDNGIREEEPISIKVFDTFSDGSQLVELNDNIFGVYKSNSLNIETSYIDDYDIIKSDLAELLDISHEEIHRIVMKDKNVGVFTLLNYSKDIETRISATTVFNNVAQFMSQGKISKEDTLWFTNILKTTPKTKGNAINDEKEVRDVIKVGLYSLFHAIELNSGFVLEEKKKDALKKSYLRMILFDLIVGRKYRGFDYYLVCSVNSNNSPIWQDARFGPISISNSIEKDSNIRDEEYNINGQLLNKKVVLKVLYDDYYNEIKKITEQLSQATKLYKDAMNIIIYNNTNVEYATKFEDIIDENIALINNLQKVKDKVLKKEINNVEKTTETHSINIGVMKKYALIIKKYSGSPTPEAIKKAYNKNSGISLMVEKNLSTQAGSVSTVVIVSFIALVCGIASGIAYVLITIGN